MDGVTGDDATGDGSWDFPWQTIQHGVDQLSSGDILYVRYAVYNETVTITTSGTPGNPTTVAAWPYEPRPVIDGGVGYTLPNCPPGYTDPVFGDWGNYCAMVTVLADYVTVSGFEIKRSRGQGVKTYDGTSHVTFSDLIIHDIKGTGAVFLGTDLVSCNYITIENCTIYDFELWAPYSRAASVLDWGSGISSRWCADLEIIDCTVYHGWGEGILPQQSGQVTIQGCTVYDCYSQLVSVDHCYDVLIDSNLLYDTGDSTWFRGGRFSEAILLGTEVGQPPVVSERFTVTNNITVGCSLGLVWWGGATDTGGLIDSLIAHNSFVNCRYNATPFYAVLLDSPYASNSEYRDNIIYAGAGATPNAQPPIYISPLGAWTLSDNAYSVNPGVSYLKVSDIIGNANIDLTDPDHALVAGAVDANWYKLLGTSDCIDAGVDVGVTDDYFGNARDANPDIGAHEV